MWGPETMKPSQALQERLKSIQQPTSQLIDALPDAGPPMPIPISNEEPGMHRRNTLSAIDLKLHETPACKKFYA